jgi:NRPS condensation-like uncharacterized protein
LRTTFQLATDGKPVQVITPLNELKRFLIQKIDFSTEAAALDLALQTAQQEAARPFNLAGGPLLRVCLVQLAIDDHLVLLTMHHIIGDNWSSNLLIQEIAVLYDAYSNSRPSPLPALAIQYPDFSAWQRGWLQGEVLQKQLDYWKNQLRALPPVLELPTDRPRPAMQTFNGDFCTLTLSTALSQQLRALSQSEGATLFMTLLAAFNVLLYRYTGQEDLSIGTPIANRTRA